MNGVINDLAGAPVLGAIVSVNLSALANEVRAALCESDCVETSSTDAEGRFSLKLPVAGFTLVRAAGLVSAPVGRGGLKRLVGKPNQ